MFNNEQTIENHGQSHFNTKPKPEWLYVAFTSTNPKTIDGVEYWPTDFINSDTYIIHDMTTVVDTSLTNSANSYYYIWYEKKESTSL